MQDVLGALLTRENVDIVFSAEVIFTCVFTICVVILVQSLLNYLKQSGPLYTRMAEIEAEISVLQAHIPVKLEQLAERRRQLEPLEEDFKLLRNYHARLNYMERKATEEERTRQEEEEHEKDKEVKRAKLGLDRYL